MTLVSLIKYVLSAANTQTVCQRSGIKKNSRKPNLPVFLARIDYIQVFVMFHVITKDLGKP